jgi:hypothetical protein
MTNKTTGVAVTIVQADATRWVVKLMDVDCVPPELVGCKTFKTASDAKEYADKCLEG